MPIRIWENIFGEWKDARMAKSGILNQKKASEKPPRFQWKRAMLGAVYGLLGGTAFALMASFVDVILHPDLPLAVNWELLVLRLSLIGLGLTLIGIFANLWVDFWPGLGSGILVAGLLALGSALYTSQSSTGLRLIVLIFALMPVAFLSLPVVLTLRWMVQWHIDSLTLRQPVNRIFGLILLILVVGFVSGSLMKMSPRAVTVTRFMNNVLQMGKNEKILSVEGISQREGMPYHLHQSKSKTLTEGFDIQVEYEDGFIVSCEVVQYPGRDPRLAGCQTAQ